MNLSGHTPDDAQAPLDTAYDGYADGRIVSSVRTDTRSSPTPRSVAAWIPRPGRRGDWPSVATASAIDRAVANARTAVRGVTWSHV